MRKTAFILVMMAFITLLLSACGGGGSNTGVFLADYVLFKSPGETKIKYGKNKNWTAIVKRGESLALLKKGKTNPAWYYVQLSDGETKGWINNKFVFIGKKAPVTFTRGGKSYSRPDEASQSSDIRNGQTALILRRMKNGWVKVNFTYKKGTYRGIGPTRWVREDSFERGIVDVKPEDVTESVNTGVGPAKVSASSVLKEAAGYTYNTKNAFDGNMATTWQEAKPGSGIGEWIEIKFPEAKMVDIEMVNGFAHNDPKYGDLYEANNRVKKIKISYGSNLEQSVTVDLADGLPSYQPIARGLSAARFRITILEVFKGSKWQDTAISEIRFTSSTGHQGGAGGGSAPTGGGPGDSPN